MEEAAEAPLLQPRGEVAAGKRWPGARRAAAEWWVESKNLWRIVGPAIFQRIALYAVNVVSQAFIGHIGDLELAALSIAATVVAGFNFGFLLGMASALETLCGQAFGAKKYHMMGVYLQRSWIALLLFAVLLTPTYILMEDLLLLIGQSPELARLAGKISVWLIPQHFAVAMLVPLTRFLQSQLKNWVTAVTAAVALAVHVVVTYLLGVVGAVIAADLSWWIVVLGQFLYVVGGGCPLSWRGFSMEAFSDFWEFIKLSSASGVMLCLENRYYRVLVLLTGYLKNAEIAVDALSIWLFSCNRRSGGQRAGRRELRHRRLRHDLRGDRPRVLVPDPLLQRQDRAPFHVERGRAWRRAPPLRAARLHRPPQQRPARALRGGYRFRMASVGRLREHRKLLPGRSSIGCDTRLAAAFRSWGDLVRVDWRDCGPDSGAGLSHCQM